MIENQTDRGRVISATLKLAAENSWTEVSLIEIAHEAQISLAELSRIFRTKSDVLEGFARAIDTEVLEETSLEKEISVRDRLFDVLMTRFELLAPFKPALNKIHEQSDGCVEGVGSPIRHLLGSQYWMMTAAGVNMEGTRGVVRAAGLASIYSSVFVIWLEDSDPGLSRTMAVLDAKLRRGENWLKSGRFIRSGLRQILNSLRQSTGSSGDKTEKSKTQGEKGGSENRSNFSPENQSA